MMTWGREHEIGDSEVMRSKKKPLAPRAGAGFLAGVLAFSLLPAVSASAEEPGVAVTVDGGEQQVSVESGAGTTVSMQLPGEATREEVSTAAVPDDLFRGDGDPLLSTSENGATVSSYTTRDGVQTLIQIPSASAAKEYWFPLGVPEGGEATLFPDETVIITDGDGRAVGGIKAPWAVDANGSSVPTTFRMEGNDLVQTVGFTEGTAFPVTADPDLGRNVTKRPITEIQARLGVPQTGVWDQALSDAVYAFQGAQEIDQDRIWGITADGLAFPPAGSIHGVDYSFKHPDIEKLTRHGVQLAGRYLWRTTYDDGRRNKGISAEEASVLRSAGIDVFFIYEEDGRELLGGFDAGVRVATAAEGFRTALGADVQPIYFAVDFNATSEEMPAILGALDGIASVIGRDRTGLYGSYDVIKAAFDAEKIAWGFQIYAWSKGKWDPRAQLQQWSNRQWNDTIDFTRAMTAEYG